MNLLQNTTELALAICEKYIDNDGCAVDCTCGRGKDTLFLAKRFKKVYSFDIQEEALESARKLLEENKISWDNYSEGNSARVAFINDSHVNMQNYVKGNSQLIVFNLGYLPGGDKNITTLQSDTLEAIQNGLKILKTGGLISIVMYPGHKNGLKEHDEIIRFAKSLPKEKFHCVYASMINQSSAAPQILWITKKK